MTKEEISSSLEEIIENCELTEKQVIALNIAAMTVNPTCLTCKFHKYIKTLKGKYSTMQLWKCTNMESEYRRTHTKGFITCNSYQRIMFPCEIEERTDEDNTKKGIIRVCN